MLGTNNNINWAVKLQSHARAIPHIGKFVPLYTQDSHWLKKITYFALHMLTIIASYLFIKPFQRDFSVEILPSNSQDKVEKGTVEQDEQDAVKQELTRNVSTEEKKPGVIQEAQPQTESSCSSNNESQFLFQLDEKYLQEQKIARSLLNKHKPLAGKPTQPKIVWKLAEKTLCFRKIDKKIQEVEIHLRNMYSQDFNSLGWHGITSWQRIVWQDEKFLELIADPNIVKHILNTRDSLRDLLLGGFAEQNPSYLFTVPPNWTTRPEWCDGELGCMGAPRVPNSPSPRQVTYDSFSLFEKGMKSVASALQDIAAKNAASLTEEENNISQWMREMNKAPVSEILFTIRNCLTKDNIGTICHGVAGRSTLPDKLNTQCNAVMQRFSEWQKKIPEGKDLSYLLGVGIVSHVLDAKHLAAAIFSGKTCSSKVCDLLNEVAEDKYLPVVVDLIKIRLLQVVQIISTHTIPK